MQLWTFQGVGFSLHDGHVNHELSEYVREVEGVRDAYLELAKRLGTDQLIWCCSVREPHPLKDRVEWVIDVPVSEILAFVDDFVWNRILGIDCVHRDISNVSSGMKRFICIMLTRTSVDDSLTVSDVTFETARPHRAAGGRSCSLDRRAAKELPPCCVTRFLRNGSQNA